MDSRERRGGSEHCVCSGSDRLCSDWGFADRIAPTPAAIHHADKKSADNGACDPQLGREYLMGGPSVWSSVAHPALSPAIEAEMWKSIKSDPPPITDAVVQFFL